MGFLDKAKSAAEQAATRAREGVEEVQAKRGLAHGYEELGRTAFELLEAGEITHERLTAPADEIRRLLAQTPAP
jgi:hypothetical protein